eukprot:CAMPEP_0184447298 /NCGR_PEP_ID=MMETSP0740-20130409/3582_1 /TAXON_ID=385413 /ORGANISM="Thalassiosira miniscula, Strain CCMP1093" /LENGTH=44 /DNA_ID= /DNA_START= /DNA_END= /DNA_ORIENTATION=
MGERAVPAVFDDKGGLTERHNDFTPLRIWCFAPQGGAFQSLEFV